MISITIGLAINFPTILIPALTGLNVENNPNETIQLTDSEVSWIGLYWTKSTFCNLIFAVRDIPLHLWSKYWVYFKTDWLSFVRMVDGATGTQEVADNSSHSDDNILGGTSFCNDNCRNSRRSSFIWFYSGFNRVGRYVVLCRNKVKNQTCWVKHKSKGNFYFLF